MKVAILTYARTNNYGATLQCYALDKYIRSLGHETVILNVPLNDGSSRPIIKQPLWKRAIRFSNRLVEKITSKFRSQSKLKDYEIRFSLSEEQRNLERYYSDKNMMIFDDFRIKYWPNLTKEYFTSKELQNDYPDAEVFVVGSDQVWNPKICGDQYPIFFLDFVKPEHKRVAYAACMGGDSMLKFSFPKKQHIKNLLRKFDNIAVRNEMAVTICKRNFRFEPRQVLDPTFLIDNYDELLSESIISDNGFMYIDKFIINDKWMDAIKNISKQKGLKIRMDNCLIEISGVEFKPLCTIQDWLGLIYRSDLVFTDSFHCSVFCILFKKQFIVAPSYQGGEGRMIDLLNKFGLSNRFYRTPEDLISNIGIWSQPIDYTKVDSLVNDLQKESKEYLISALTK